MTRRNMKWRGWLAAPTVASLSLSTLTLAALLIPSPALAQRDSTPPGLDFLREPQDRLRVDLDGDLLELTNARWTDERIRFDFAWSTADPSRVRDVPAIALDRVRAVYRRRTDRRKGALIGGLSGLGIGILIAALNEQSAGDAVPMVLGYTGISALIGMLRFKSTKWERVFP